MFTKVTGKRCINPECPERGKLVGPRATTCKHCIKPLDPVTTTNVPAIAGVAVVALGLMGGGGYYAYTTYKPSIPGFGGGDKVEEGKGKEQLVGEPRVAYSVQVESNGFQTVATNHIFRGGDKLRILVKPAFQAHIYLFHEDAATGKIDILPTGDQPMNANLESSIPPRGTIFMDKRPAQEKFTLIASAKPLPELAFDPKTSLTVAQFQAIADRVFTGFEATSSSDNGWSVIQNKDKNGSMVRATFTLKHE